MRYIITEKQYSKLIEQETSSQTSTTTTTPATSKWEYGKQMKLFDDGTKPNTQSATTGNISATLYYDKEQKKQTPANYIVSKMTKINDGPDGLEINLGSFSINTDCAKISNGDNSFRYKRENKTFYSTDLANKVKNNFKCV